MFLLIPARSGGCQTWVTLQKNKQNVQIFIPKNIIKQNFYKISLKLTQTISWNVSTLNFTLFVARDEKSSEK